MAEIQGVCRGRVNVSDCVLSLDFILQFQNPGPPTRTRLTVKNHLENLFKVQNAQAPLLEILAQEESVFLKKVSHVILEYIQV